MDSMDGFSRGEIHAVRILSSQLIVLSDAEGCARLRGIATDTLELPAIDPFAAPILYSIPVQLLAYHVAVLKGTDVDQPRNLAKSVTVE